MKFRCHEVICLFVNALKFGIWLRRVAVDAYRHSFSAIETLQSRGINDSPILMIKALTVFLNGELYSIFSHLVNAGILIEYKWPFVIAGVGKPISLSVPQLHLITGLYDM